ncbi:MAG: hypothetical protein EOS07_33255 [Mesorhizobium sp.]|nr:MAG: hypothetical protein EOS07_33255 [Mesorhizobium sp.]
MIAGLLNQEGTAFAPWFAAYGSARVQQPEKLATIGTLSVPLCLQLPLQRGRATSAEPNPLISKSLAEGRIARLPEIATESGCRLEGRYRHHLWSTATVAANEATSIITTWLRERKEHDMSNTSKQGDWTKPAAMAIPKGGFFKDEVEQGRYGPIFPKTPACYGFSIKGLRNLAALGDGSSA